MENTFVPKDLPVEHSEGSSVSSAHDIRCLDHAVDDMLGPVLVGHVANSDCFYEIDGTKPKEY